MIIGHGIDLQDVASIERAYEKNNRFAKRLLTTKEIAIFETLKGRKRRMEYLSGRWAAKEAFAKATGTGIGKLSFQDIEILSDDKGAPQLYQTMLSQVKVWLSISHSAGFAQASVIIEKIGED